MVRKKHIYLSIIDASHQSNVSTFNKVFGLYYWMTVAFVFQFGLYFVELKLTEWLVTDGHYTLLNIHNVHPMYGMIQEILFPTSLVKFISIYSFAYAALTSLFAGILIERSY